MLVVVVVVVVEGFVPLNFFFIIIFFRLKSREGKMVKVRALIELKRDESLWKLDGWQRKPKGPADDFVRSWIFISPVRSNCFFFQEKR